MRRMAMEGKSFWKSQAGKNLKASRTAYAKGISFTVVDGMSFYLELSDPLAASVELGAKGFDMKPGLLKNALTWPPQKRKIPRAIAAGLPSKSGITRYKIVPLNPNHYINMQKPTVFRMVTDKSPASSWIHPGWKGVNLVAKVKAEMISTIIPKHMRKLIEDM